MALRTSKKYQFRYADTQLEELDFCSRLTSGMNDESTIEELRGKVREIIFRYGWNVAKYPSHVSYTFWAIITGDYWGNFKRKINDTSPEEILDVSDPHIVEYRA